MSAFVLRCLIPLTLCCISNVAFAASIYKWIGPEGTTHYANSHPSDGSVQVLEPERGTLIEALTGLTSPQAVARSCPTQLCTKVSKVDPYCRTLQCRIAHGIEDDCFSPTCQRKRQKIETWLSQQSRRNPE